MDKGVSVDKPFVANEGQLVTCRNCGEHWPYWYKTCSVCDSPLWDKPKAKPEPDPDSGNKDDQGKLRYDLIPTWSLEQLAAVMTYGATTYGDHNWRRGMDYSRLYAAAQRHMNAFWQGEDTDKDSGRPHLAHAAANMLMLLEFCHRGYDDLGFDDRMYEALCADEIRAMVLAGAA